MCVQFAELPGGLNVFVLVFFYLFLLSKMTFFQDIFSRFYNTLCTVSMRKITSIGVVDNDGDVDIVNEQRT